MRRRAFITLVGGAAAAWPLAVRAQQGERMRRMGIFTGVGEGDLDTQARHAALLQALAQLGWADGHNLQIDVRWGGGDAERIRKSATELAALAPDLSLPNIISARSIKPLCCSGVLVGTNRILALVTASQ